MYYIQETDKPVLIAKMLNLVEVVSDKIILPVTKNETIEGKRGEIFTKKIKKIIDKTNCKNIILSKYLKKQEKFVEVLEKQPINIIDGKWLFSVMSSKALDYIVKKKNLKKEETNVGIMINNISNDFIIENIKKIINTYKNVNIVTKHIEKFKKLEKDIFEHEGTMIIITNNKKKSLSRAKIILNVDFNSEEINKYSIIDDAIIVNLKGNVEITKKRFNGLNINDYEIRFENIEEFDYDKQNLYSQKDIYEASIYKKQPYENIERKINKDKVEIVELMGKRTSF